MIEQFLQVEQNLTERNGTERIGMERTIGKTCMVWNKLCFWGWGNYVMKNVDDNLQINVLLHFESFQR